MLPRASGIYCAVAQAVRLDSTFMVVHVGIEQRYVQMLAAAGSYTPQQSGAYRTHSMESSAAIAQRNHRDIGRAVWLTAHGDNSSIGSPQVIDAGLVG